jgi:hypothetical protein
MSILTKHLEFVNEQIRFQERMIEKFKEDPHRVILHTKTRQNFEDLLDSMENCSCQGLSQINEKPAASISLPKELIAELSRKAQNIDESTEMTVYDLIISSPSREVSLDKLLIDYYNKTKETLKREQMVHKLYRLKSRGLIKRANGKKGWYTINS